MTADDRPDEWARLLRLLFDPEPADDQRDPSPDRTAEADSPA